MIIDIPLLDRDLLEQIGAELGGCDFSNDAQREFLAADGSCDVQAVPGNGKTTLLVAKLALLSRTWGSRFHGVCVISHTNAARDEVADKLRDHPSASNFLGYPHFIGTVMAFVDRFIALPYLRGLGWPIQRIDDEVFGAVALARWRSKGALVRFASIRGGRNTHSIETWVSNMALDAEFDASQGDEINRLKIVRYNNRQPGPNSDTGRALEELKAELSKDGFYRYEDMTALACQALETKPEIIQRLRLRFPLVLLDEAQDTNGSQLALLNRIFGNGVAYQRLGDQNQTLYEDDRLSPEDYWTARDETIPLDETRRFGPGIAKFASRLTVRADQRIEGRDGIPSRMSLILFDRPSISEVLPAYAEEVLAHWGQDFLNTPDVWAVASRHNPARDPTGEWPKTLADYCPDYRSGRGRRNRPDTLCCAMRQAEILHEACSATSEIVDLLSTSLVALLRRQGIDRVEEIPLNKKTLWRVLDKVDVGLPLRVRRLFRDRILSGASTWSADGWSAFCDELVNLLGFDGAVTADCQKFLQFVDEGAISNNVRAGEGTRTEFVHEGLKIKLGSIHSLKGKTVDGILIAETEVWRGQRLDQRAMDLTTTLPHAFEIEDRDFDQNVAQLAAATNVFVAATRPRQLLSCAMRRESVTEELLIAARDQGWLIRDLTV